MTPRSAFWKWFVIGAVASSLIAIAQAAAVGGAAGMLQVGETSSLRPLIEAQLGDVPLAPGPGHDGQIYYAIGLDLSGQEVPELLDHGAYRYRRILYPAVASLGGLTEGWPLLYGMIALAVLSAAVATGVVAATAVRGGASEWLALTVLFNPGVWLSVRLLTADVLALCLMVAGLWYVSSRRSSSLGWFTASVLAKDVYLATPGGLAVSRDRTRWVYALVPLTGLVVWMTWLTISMGDGFTGRGNLAVPFTGIADATSTWTYFSTEEWAYLAFAVASVAAGLIVGVVRRGWLRWSILAWSLLGVVSSSWVWDFGNNAARAFAPLVVLIALGYVGTTTDSSSSARTDEPATR